MLKKLSVIFRSRLGAASHPAFVYQTHGSNISSLKIFKLPFERIDENGGFLDRDERPKKLSFMGTREIGTYTRRSILDAL